MPQTAQEGNEKGATLHGTVVEQCAREKPTFSGLRVQTLFHRFGGFYFVPPVAAPKKLSPAPIPCRFSSAPSDYLLGADSSGRPRVHSTSEKAMKYVCLGYIEDGKWERMSADQRKAMMEECFAYDDQLRAGGHFLGGEALGSPRNAATLRFDGGKVTITDGPYAETKEQLGGILLLEAKDLNHAIALMSKHPGVGLGPFEIRPANEAINRLIAERSAAVARKA